MERRCMHRCTLVWGGEGGVSGWGKVRGWGGLGWENGVGWSGVPWGAADRVGWGGVERAGWQGGGEWWGVGGRWGGVVSGGVGNAVACIVSARMHVPGTHS
jgi:hypothetical protein